MARHQLAMLSLLEFKKSLGPLAEQISDEEIVRIRDVFDKIADIAFERYLKERNGSKPTVIEVKQAV
jgi:hypothetical protein